MKTEPVIFKTDGELPYKVTCPFEVCKYEGNNKEFHLTFKGPDTIRTCPMCGNGHVIAMISNGWSNGWRVPITNAKPLEIGELTGVNNRPNFNEASKLRMSQWTQEDIEKAIEYLQSLDAEREKTEYIPYQLCPRCHGEGFAWGFNQTTSSSSVKPKCNVCNGAGVIAMAKELTRCYPFKLDWQKL